MNKKLLRDIAFILLGTALISAATKYVYLPASLDTGGISGVAVIWERLWGVPLWITNTAFNIPLFLLGLRFKGWRFLRRTLAATALMSLELLLLPEMPSLPHEDLFLSAVFGGLLSGAGCGMVFSAMATTGGTDMLGNSLSKYLRHISVGHLIEFLDGAIVLVGAFVFSIENTLYAIISVFIMGRVTDYIIDRGKKAKIALIISKKPKEIADEILSELDRGVTSLDGIGEYTGEHRRILICICTRRDVPMMKDIVREYDPKAFFIVGNISEAMGEGFVEKWM